MTQELGRQKIGTSSKLNESDLPAQPDATAFEQAAESVRNHWLRLLAVSAIMLVPCFWHRHIVAGDLGSHLYNAWLVQLIERGQVPGLWIARQWHNVLFDFLLSGLASVFGLRVAEKIAVSLSVLIFFWGMFALVCAAARRAPWFLLPCLAMFTYGWTFAMGFFNFYLSLGLSFFGLAIFWRGKGWERLIAFALAPLVLLGHAIGLLWMLGAAAYVGIAEILPRRYHILLLLLAVALLLFLHQYLWHHYIVTDVEGPYYVFNGTDQLVLFSERYVLPAVALLFLAVVALLLDAASRWREPGYWSRYIIPLQLYLIAELGVLSIPDGIHFPQVPAPLALLTERLTSISAALMCCLLGVMRPRKWHLFGFTVIAVLFFSLVYQNTSMVSKMEGEVEKLVRNLPPGQRVLATIPPPPGSRVLVQHIVDRACIGHCFSYGNYEPSSGAFRVRALPGNHYVMTDFELTASMEEGTYDVQPEDLPAYQIYLCNPERTEVCIRPLEAGEENDRLGDNSE